MKKPRSLTGLSLVLILTTAVIATLNGCAAKTVVTAPVPGSLNTFDAYAYRVLYDTQAAINAFKSDVSSGKVVETTAIKQYLNAAISDYNIAEAAYQAWHAAGGTGSTTTVSTALTKVQTDLSSAASAAVSTTGVTK